MASRANTPITVALVDDYDVVLMGVANMFDQYRDQVVVAELDSNKAVEDAVDIVLYDSFAQPESDHDEIAVLVANPRARRVVVYTWNFHPDLIRSAQQHGAHGYLSKTLPARELVAAWRRCMPARRSSAMFRRGRAAPLGSIGPAEAKGSAIESRRSWPSSRRARAMPRSRR
jgi:DNA-binding NarL/FixJ family response regulator